MEVKRLKMTHLIFDLVFLHYFIEIKIIWQIYLIKFHDCVLKDKTPKLSFSSKTKRNYTYQTSSLKSLIRALKELNYLILTNLTT